MASNDKQKLRCKNCGNTESFFRMYAGNVQFKTIEEMHWNDGEFLDWDGSITCDKCGEDDVEEVMIVGEQNE